MPRQTRASRPFPGPGRLVALLLLVSACGGDTPGAPPPPPPVPPPPPPPIDGGPYEGVACPALQPARTTGQPLDRVVVGQVPGTFQAPYFAYVEEANGPAQGFSLLEVNDAGALELVVPVHPTGAPAGGAVRVWISDGTRACASFDFTVQALPPAPGEFATVVGLVQELVTLQAVALGTTPAELTSLPPDQVPPALLGVAVAQALVDHPGNDRSLVAVAAGTSPISSSLPLALLESVLARTGLRTALETAGSPTAMAGRSRDPGGIRSSRAAQRHGEGCTPADVGQSAAELDRCMRLRHELADKVDGGALENLGTLLAVAAAQLGVSLDDAGGARDAGFIVHLLEWATLVPAIRGMGALPDWPLEGTVAARPAAFAEDDPGPGTWTLEVTASSRGYRVEQHNRTTLDRAIEKMGRPGLIGLLRLAGANEVVKAMLRDDPAALDVEPMVFGPVDISDEAWSESSFPPNAAVVRLSHANYAPRTAGEATLTVIGKVSPAWTSFQQPIEVREIEMTISPTEVVLTAGEEVEFTVTVTGTHTQNAVDTLLRGSAPRGTIVSWERVSVVAGDVGHTEVYRLRYRAPSQPGDDQSVEVGLKHTARTGARAAPASPERRAFAVVRFGKVEISPPGGFCLEPGVPQAFTATVTGLTNQAVNWTASLGQITSGGVYTAQPSTPPGTEVTITATSQVNDKVKDQVTIQVGGCGCAFQIELDGNIYTAQSGDSVSYADFGGLTGFSIHTWQDPQAPSLRRTAAVGVPVDPRISGPGAWNFGPDQAESGDLLGTLAAPADHVWWNGGEHNFFSFVLDRYERGVEMAGSLSGFTNLESLLDSSIRIVPISMSFSMHNTEPDFLGIIHTCVVK